MSISLVTRDFKSLKHTYLADVVGDVASLPVTLGEVNVGATCYVIGENKTYYLSVQRTWTAEDANPVLASPIYSPTATAQTIATPILITNPSAAAAIYYVLTSNGSTPADPTSGSTLYDGQSPPVVADAAETKIKAIAILANYTDSAIVAESYTVAQVATPAPTASGTKLVGDLITITDATAGSTIYYTITTEGSTPADPTSSSTAYTAPIAITAVAATKLKAIAYKSGYRTSSVSNVTTYATDQVATPVADPIAGEVLAGSEVAFTCATSGASMYYTTDGNTPTVASTPYTVPIVIPSAASTTIKVLAVKTGLRNSAVSSDAFTTAQVAQPDISPNTAEVLTTQEVTMTCATGDAEIRYTINDTAPTAASTLYVSASKPVVGANASVVFRAKAFKTGLRDSAEAVSATLTTAQVAAVTVDPAAGAVDTNVSITLASVTAGSAIHYTLNGDTPTIASATYSAPLAIDAAKTIKAIATKSGLRDSGVTSAAYTLNKCAAVVLNPSGGAVADNSEVAMTCATSGAAIYYTLDGGTPSASTTLYNSESKPVIDVAKRVRAIAIKANTLDSDITTADYTIA